MGDIVAQAGQGEEVESRRAEGHTPLSPENLGINFYHTVRSRRLFRLSILFTRQVTMGIAFDYAPDRPQHIENILNSLERYNPETTTTFQDYVSQQCEDRTYDCYANLALLKLYVELH